MRDFLTDRRCAHCGGILNNKEKIRSGEIIKYCSPGCRGAAHDLRRYYKNIKTNPAWVERRRVYAKNWRDRQKKLGNCTRCGGFNDNKEYNLVVCSKCRSEVSR